MSGTELLMTASAFENLRAELERLETVVRPAALADVESARTDSVNVGESGTHLSAIAHKEQVDARIAEVRSRMERAVVTEAASDGSVGIGTVVHLDYGDGDIDVLVLDDVGRDDAVAVTASSPLGRALLGTRPGDVVRWSAPVGEMTATVADLR